MSMNTKMLGTSDAELDYAAKLLSMGEVVGFPTETVYGLGADASDSEAVKKIFVAKGRPSDNPLIVHIADFEDIHKAVTFIPENAIKLAEAFWPGPLTMIFPKSDQIPNVTSGGLQTVGIRLPEHPVARKLIRKSGKLIAAPSANRSGLPSPTTAQHVFADMQGRIPAIVDGGSCRCGVESTVLSFESDGTPHILRPGFITKEMIALVCGNVILDPALFRSLSPTEQAASPGMKYKHYAPQAEVILIEGNQDAFVAYLLKHQKEGTYALLPKALGERLSVPYLDYGETEEMHSQLLFARLREADERGAKRVYVPLPSTEGVGLAVYNRLLRAAAFHIIKVSNDGNTESN